MKIGLTNITSYIPENRMQIEEILELGEFERKEALLLRRVYGINQVPIVENNQRLEETLKNVVSKIPDVENIGIDFILYGHSVTAQVPHDYNLLRKVFEPLGLGDVTAMGISQFACASSFFALQLAEIMLKKREDINKILLLLGDQTNMLSQGRYIKRSTVIGDAASAVIIEKNTPDNQLLALSVLKDTRFCEGYYATAEQMAKFNEGYVPFIITAINEVLRKANISLKEVNYILPHNVNKVTWKSFVKHTNYPFERVILDLLSDIGHTYTSDSFLILDHLNKQKRLKKGDKFLMISVGIGSFIGVALFQH